MTDGKVRMKEDEDSEGVIFYTFRVFFSPEGKVRINDVKTKIKIHNA